MPKPKKPQPSQPEPQGPAQAVKMGRPDSLAEYREALGENIACSFKIPAPIAEILKDNAVKRLLARMAIDEGFKKKVLHLR